MGVNASHLHDSPRTRGKPPVKSRGTEAVPRLPASHCTGPQAFALSQDPYLPPGETDHR